MASCKPRCESPILKVRGPPQFSLKSTRASKKVSSPHLFRWVRCARNALTALTMALSGRRGWARAATELGFELLPAPWGCQHRGAGRISSVSRARARQRKSCLRTPSEGFGERETRSDCSHGAHFLERESPEAGRWWERGSRASARARPNQPRAQRGGVIFGSRAAR